MASPSSRSGRLSWLAIGLMTGPAARSSGPTSFSPCLNLFGIWRWLGRQARIEEGATAAAEASEQRSGRSAVSGVAAAQGADRGSARASCSAPASTRWPAAAAAGSHYVVVSEGGIAGVGETLRRLPWSSARCRCRQARSRARRQLRRGSRRSRRTQWPVALIVTAELAPHGLRLAQRPAPPPLSGRAQPRAGAPHDVPRDCRRPPRPSFAQILRSHVGRAASAGLDRRRDEPRRGRRLPSRVGRTRRHSRARLPIAFTAC